MRYIDLKLLAAERAHSLKCVIDIDITAGHFKLGIKVFIVMRMFIVDINIHLCAVVNHRLSPPFSICFILVPIAEITGTVTAFPAIL